MDGSHQTPEFLRSKSEGVKDSVKHIIKEIKKEQKLLEQDEKWKRQLGHFADCGESYWQAVVIRKARIEVLIEQKISLEKYSKKLKHMAKEAEEGRLAS